MRRVPTQFSWVDQRLVRDRHLDHLDVYAAALYLFLVTVADAQGLSWYGDTSTAKRLSIDEIRLQRARDDLIRAGLLAYVKPLYQVLALGESLSRSTPVVATASVPAVPVTDHADVREHLAALHAALGRRT
jgi:hypothetical protein